MSFISRDGTYRTVPCLEPIPVTINFTKHFTTFVTYFDGRNDGCPRSSDFTLSSELGKEARTQEKNFICLFSRIVSEFVWKIHF
ncbi:hypothetical protein TNCT_430431 [Trichonephila clavata]|uniref:Uncharacterized protein n=1 Tax=Trichonephila clavata TaxID=2740835 RepID=A0A8X6HRV2_TRICU|nr:hypothetical protein TNCT_430431 [Trichonephila clavata]